LEIARKPGKDRHSAEISFHVFLLTSQALDTRALSTLKKGHSLIWSCEHWQYVMGTIYKLEREKPQQCPHALEVLSGAMLFNQSTVRF